VAALPGVRAALLDFQKAFATREGGAVLDGRDIGTVICPRAEVKLYVTASDAVRAKRRYEELKAKKPETTLERVQIDLRQRDIRDASRDVAPMRAPDDALLLDTSELSIDAAVAEAVALVRKRFEQV
jgi:cytidylate kinase